MSTNGANTLAFWGKISSFYFSVTFEFFYNSLFSAKYWQNPACIDAFVTCRSYLILPTGRVCLCHSCNLYFVANNRVFLQFVIFCQILAESCQSKIKNCPWWALNPWPHDHHPNTLLTVVEGLHPACPSQCIIEQVSHPLVNRRTHN